MTLPPFEEVVVTHGPTVLRVCRALLRSSDAEDLWSETFLAALRAYPDVRPDSNLEAWLVTIARRKAIDHHRAGARRPATVPLEPELAEADDGFPPLPDPELWAAVGALPRRQREAVVYHHVAGLPYARVAEVAGTTEVAARRAAADGIRQLRRRLASTGAAPEGRP